jgi:orotidine-5'-phosphate decarboxylase
MVEPMKSFLIKLHRAVEMRNSCLAIGLDPNISILPKQFLEKKEPLYNFCQWIVDQTHEFTGVYKIQFAYFEAMGPSGYEQLEKTIHYIKSHYPDHFVIADAKRGDIADTSEAYATGIFDYLQCDAVTLHPYLGQEALQPFLKRADKGSIILCRTSNPGAGELQDLGVRFQVSARSKEESLWEHIAWKVSQEWNANGNCLLVVGATYPEELKRVRYIVGDMWLLIPGIGAQGGDLKQVLQAGLTPDKQGLLISASRSIIFSDSPREEAEKLRDDINRLR